MLGLPDDSSETERKMSEFARICAKAELPASGDAKEFPAGQRILCVANEHGQIAAMDNVCPHRGGPLGQGMVEGGKVICPWHAWAFDMKTGAAQHSPDVHAQVFELKIEGEDVLVKL
jgi:nitrite reductase (NADH) small subunit